MIGRLGEEQDIPLPYRGQDPPALPDPTVLAALPSEEARAFALKRCMTRSSSSSTPVAHASLGLPAYVQFTSPIRRYSDVIAHWQVKAWLRGADLPFSRRDIDAIMTSVSEVGRDLNRWAGGAAAWCPVCGCLLLCCWHYTAYCVSGLQQSQAASRGAALSDCCPGLPHVASGILPHSEAGLPPDFPPFC